MLIRGDDRRSRLESCRAAAAQFLLNDIEAREIIETQILAIRDNWDGVCEEAGLSKIDRAFLWRRQFLNDYAFEGYAGAPAGP